MVKYKSTLSTSDKMEVFEYHFPTRLFYKIQIFKKVFSKKDWVLIDENNWMLIDPFKKISNDSKMGFK